MKKPIYIKVDTTTGESKVVKDALNNDDVLEEVAAGDVLLLRTDGKKVEQMSSDDGSWSEIETEEDDA